MTLKQPIIFDIQYTPYRLPRNATEFEQAAHREARSFYDLSGEKNALKYISTDSKRGVKKTALEYFEKTTGVFNRNGMLTEEEITEIQRRAKKNQGNIWHGFISLGEEDSPKIDTVEKCISLVKGTFGGFFKDMRMNEKNLDLICALHTDRPHHYHIHYLFFEKEPKYKGSDGKLRYRSKGRIEKTVIEKMKVRLGLFLSSDKVLLSGSRTEAIRALRGAAELQKVMTSPESIQKELILLAKALPKTGRLSYGSKDMEPYRGRVDGIVRMLLSYDKTARNADARFYQALEERKAEIDELCKLHKIDAEKLDFIEDLGADYRRRQGNILLNFAKILKPEIYERIKKRKQRANDTALKRNLSMSRRKTDRLCKKFFSSFGNESLILSHEFSNRLREIEREIERLRDRDEARESEQEEQGGYYRN